mgnify:CR=1 FL=1
MSTRPATAERIVVQTGPVRSKNELLIGGQAYEIDWRNVNTASRADINVNAPSSLNVATLAVTAAASLWATNRGRATR